MPTKVSKQIHGENEEALVSAGATVGVVGLGYVGLQLAHVFDDAGYTVHGFDVDDTKIQQLQNGIDPTGEISPAKLQEGSVSYTVDPACLRSCEYIVLSVPTPIDGSRKPDLGLVEAAGETVGAHLSTGATVVLESTVYPGVTKDVLLPALESASGLTAGDDFFVGYSPERVVPGEGGRDFRDIVKIVSARDETTARRLKRFYERTLDVDVHVAPTIETAEAAKCLENVQRDLNIGLINEFAIACNSVDLGIDPAEVLTAAGTKWNFHQYRPGLVGGHCLPVDPYFLIDPFERNGYSLQLPKVARQVNEQVPTYVATRLTQAMEQRRERAGTARARERILIAGLSYKPESTDIRSSAVSQIIAELREHEFDLVGYEPHVGTDRLTAEFDMPFQESFSVADFDALVVPTAHRELKRLDMERVASAMNDDPILVDICRAFPDEPSLRENFRYISL